jgi:hypothetical protein
MIKGIIRFLLTTFLILVLAIIYLSIFGIKTNKFNNKITDSILKINNKINLSLKDVKYLLNPYNFTVDIKTKNPKISIEGTSITIKDIQTNVSLKSLIKDQFSIDYLQFETTKIKLNNIVTLARVFENSPQLYVLGTIIKDGFINANVRLNFDEKGKIKQDYKIDGSITEAKLNVLNKLKFKNLNFNFDIEQNIYSLKQIDMILNDIKISSPKVEIKENKSLFSVNGQFLNDERIFSAQELKTIFVNLPSNIDIKKIEFSSTNDFSFNISKNLKFDNFKIKSIVDLKQLVLNEKILKLNLYLPSFIENIEFLKHEIIIDYDKKNLDIKGSGNILLEKNLDSLSYEIKTDKDNFLFNSKINIKNNSLLIEFLDYEKKEGSNSLLSLKGNFKKNSQLSFDLINLKEKNNEILIKGLDLSKDLKIIDIQNLKLNYVNDKKILNNLNLKKDNTDFIIKGESFDASRIVNNILDSDDESSSIFNNLNSKIDIKIKKTYIDEVNFIHNLFGDISYNDNEIEYLRLESIFPNEKKINLSIETKNNSEVITRLFTDYPKPLVKRYDFIKGFEEGSLDFYSLKKGSKSNSVLIIDNFKVKEVPVFAKLLSLASLQGIADLLTGEGVRFTDFEMSFSNQKGLTTINEMYAIGPAVSILMDGYIKSKELVSLRGTLVPATTINRSIASIPILGKILIGDKTGEGVFGVSFKIKGPPKDLKTSVNPIKTLTPRFITRTLEKIKKN